MRPGSVIVDIAAASGGNTDLTEDGDEIDHRGVLIIGAGDLPSDVATHASSLYARNVTNLVMLLVKDGRLAPDFDDDIVAATCVTADGEIRHEATRQSLEESAS
jgi:NAD(P) transhydrogenase subunit alpha